MSDRVTIREGRAPADGAELYYKAVGGGEPVVVLHGGPGFDHQHLEAIGRLSDGWRVIFYDQRATGYSTGEPTPEQITVERFVEDLEGLREHLGLGSMHVIGHSWGATLALRYGVTHPQRLRSLVAMSASGASRQFWPQYLMNLRQRMGPANTRAMQQVQLSEAWRRRDPEAVAEYYRLAVGAMFHESKDLAKLNLAFAENTARNQWRVAELIRRDLGDLDFHKELTRIACPALILHGDDDPFPVAAARRLHDHLPDSRLVVLPECGHFPFVEAPRETFGAIRSFLAGVTNE